MKKKWFKIKAVLDDQTCEFCRKMHGKIVTKKEELPPFHSKSDSEELRDCRCVAEEILLEKEI